MCVFFFLSLNQSPDEISDFSVLCKFHTLIFFLQSILWFVFFFLLEGEPILPFGCQSSNLSFTRIQLHTQFCQFQLQLCNFTDSI